MNKKKWIVYGVTGAVGLAVLGGAAAATASTMDLRTTGGDVLPGGAITGKDGGVLDRGNVTMRVTDSSVTVVSAPSPAVVATPSVVTPASVASAPSPAPAPAAPAPAPADSPASPPSPVSPVSPVSPASVASAASN